MPIPTPFHARAALLCESQEWRDWAGYLAAVAYEHSHEREYYAIRNAAALIDISPLFKYEVCGPEAVRLLDRVMTRAASKCAVGQMMYSPWCDDDGKVIDDGTFARLEAERFRITSAEPNLAWFQDCAIGLDVQVSEISEQLAALALQGPNARAILLQVARGADLEALGYYRLAQGFAGDIPLTITRTGYTGDLGYELWVAPENALALWDLLLKAGEGYGLTPAGMAALDIARIEAGLILIQVDYVSSRKALIESQKSSPFEIGLGWTVDLSKEDFVGRKALLAESERPPAKRLVGLEVDWQALEAAYAAIGLTPPLAGRASRSAAPLYRRGRQVGQATSHAFSPLLKKYVAIASIEGPSAAPGSAVDFEITVEYTRQAVRARLVKLPFFDPPRKRALGLRKGAQAA